MNLEDILVNEPSQSQEDKYCVLPLMYLEESNSLETESRMMAARAREGERRGEWRVNVEWVHSLSNAVILLR